MPKKELFINDKDAFDEWGISMDMTSLSALMTPPPSKELPENNSRRSNGKKFVSGMPRKVADRDLTLTINLSAPDESEFFARYLSFCEELKGGALNIRTKYQPKTTYRCEYLSCNQFTQFMRGIASFSLRLNEPDPTNRS